MALCVFAGEKVSTQPHASLRPRTTPVPQLVKD